MSTETELVIERGGERYMLQPTEDSLRVGQLHDDGVTWLDVQIPLSSLGGEARKALADADVASPALAIALNGVEAALANRGG